MIGYRDFAPRQTSPPGLLARGEYDSFDAAVAAANQWIAQERAEVVSIETVVLPNIWSRHEEGTADPSVGTIGNVMSTWHQFVRVWYRTQQPASG